MNDFQDVSVRETELEEKDIYPHNQYLTAIVKGYDPKSRPTVTSIIQPKVLAKALRRADVVIGALRSNEKRTPCVVSENMVENMKEGAVIIDVSIDQGGCVETSEITSHAKPTLIKHGVVHYGVPNIPTRVARTASYALSNLLTPTLLKLGEEGGIEPLIVRDCGVRQGVYVFHGMLTNKMVGQWFDINYKEIDLLIASI